MQFQQTSCMTCEIAFLIIVLVSDVMCIRNEGAANGNDGLISANLHIYAPSDPLNKPQIAARQSVDYTNRDFRPSQMLEFTLSDASQVGAKQYPPSYLAPNYKYQVPSSLASPAPAQTAGMESSFAFPSDEEQPSKYFTSISAQAISTPLPSTPVTSYLDPFTQQNLKYAPQSPNTGQDNRQREQNEDQVYTVQSSLLVGNPAPPHLHPGDKYMKRPGYVFDERPFSVSSSQHYRQPTVKGHQKGVNSHKISYDSHDYPPPSYAAQQTSNFIPQPQKPSSTRPLTSYTIPAHNNRQDIYDNRPLTVSSINERPTLSGPSSSSNYANNFGNYLHRPLEAPLRPEFQYKPLPQLPPQQPENNFYEYQIGEIPPQVHQQPQQQFHNNPPSDYRPPHHPMPQPTGGGGLATLASLLASTQQYAPQFSNLLLGGETASSSVFSNRPLDTLVGAFISNGNQHSQKPSSARPSNTQLIRALENIARNDDLQCVPKVLCQMIASQTSRGQLPGFVTSPAITRFLTGFPGTSPAIIYGRAALLGISGGERSCVQTYEKCPKNEMEIIHYLNNHRGGFFKLFSEPEEQPLPSHQGGSESSSWLNILSALSGGINGDHLVQPKPQAAPQKTSAQSTGIANGIVNFFSHILTEQLNGVEYERRRKRSVKIPNHSDDFYIEHMDFHDEEDDLDTVTNIKFGDNDEGKDHNTLSSTLQFPDDIESEGRIIVHKDIEGDSQTVRFPESEPEDDGKIFYEFNLKKAQRKLKFPKEQSNLRESRQVEIGECCKPILTAELSGEKYDSNQRNEKRIVFKDTNEELNSSPQHKGTETKNDSHNFHQPLRGAKIMFPDYLEQYTRRGKILNRPTYAPNYEYTDSKTMDDHDRLVVSDAHRPQIYTQDLTDHTHTGHNTNYINYNQYSHNYLATSTWLPKREDDKNVYINNERGVTEYYIRPDGRKIYLKT